jgi:N-acetylmuramoyl-L-alanine amidase
MYRFGIRVYCTTESTPSGTIRKIVTICISLTYSLIGLLKDMKLSLLNQTLKVAKNSIPVILLGCFVATLTNYKPSDAVNVSFYNTTFHNKQDKKVPVDIARKPSNSDQKRALVVIDPGHGGEDLGTKISINGLVEKDVVLPISKKVAEILQKNGIEVVMTRKADSFISLEERVNITQRANATLFVSIHANSKEGSPKTNGLETYYSKKSENRRLAEVVHKHIIKNVSIANGGIKEAEFYILRKPKMPSLLIETGYLSGLEDAPKLANSKFRDQMADAIAGGIVQYLKQEGKLASTHRRK